MLKKSVYSYRMRKDTSKAHIKVTYTGDKIKGQHGVVYDVYDASIVDAREVGSPCEWRGGARHCSRAMGGDSGLETC